MVNTGATYPGTTGTNTSIGTQDWTNTGNISADDNVTADCLFDTVDQISYYLKATNFGFSIPTGSTIDGIVAEVQCWDQGVAFNTIENSVKIVKGGTISGDEKSTGAGMNSPPSSTTFTYGSSSDLWGLSWTVSDINASDFGLVWSSKCTSTMFGGYTNVDFIRITIYYTEGAGPPSPGININIGDAWKSSTAIQINIGDSWKKVTGVQVNIGDTWKPV